jgi:hypothetical protein
MFKPTTLIRLQRALAAVRQEATAALASPDPELCREANAFLALTFPLEQLIGAAIDQDGRGEILKLRHR